MGTVLTRIGFGCARLRGGMEEGNSRRVLDAAFAAGIRHFDTAPSYGNGASERIVGSALRDVRGQVQICTKIGSKVGALTPRAKLRSAAVALARAALPGSLLARLKGGRRGAARPLKSARGYGDFDCLGVRASAERSFEQLQTDHVDCLMLHEPRMSDPSAELAQWLGSLVQDGRAASLGVGTYAELDQLPAFGQVAQFAVGPMLIDRGDSRTLVGHGLLRDFDRLSFEQLAAELRLYEAVPALEKAAARSPVDSALLLNLVLRGTDVSRILVSSDSPKRLQEFIAAALMCEQELSARQDAPWSAQCRPAVSRYLRNAAEHRHG